MEMSTVKDAFNRAIKKQKLSFSRSNDVIDQVNHEISQVLVKLLEPVNAPVDSVSTILTDLKLTLDAFAPLNQLEGSQKELNMNLGKYIKVLEKSWNPDISKAGRNIDFDPHLVDQIIANHFYQQGLFDLGDCLMIEVGKDKDATLRSDFVDLHHIVGSMKVRNIEPALNWASANHGKLKDIGSNLELKLHRLDYFELLKKGNREEALLYARTHISPFASRFPDEFQKLMGAMLWVGRLEKSPYAELCSSSTSGWEVVTDELTRHFYALIGQSRNSPLSVALSAGSEALPTLLKLVNVMSANKKEWQEMTHLPVPLEIRREFQFHSTFVCPVSRDQSSNDNPPMLLPCQHVLCKQSIMRLSKNNSSRTFKCPYCPVLASAAACRRLYL